jgi:tetratricopeptide (TPR) repeat protein
MAIGRYADAIDFVGNPARGVTLLQAAWDEFADLETTPAGVALMSAMASCYSGVDDNLRSLEWCDRCLPVAERLGLMEATVRMMVRRGATLFTLSRPWEGMALLRGGHQLSLANDIAKEELTARNLISFFEQWSEPPVGLAIGREGLEIGRRLGSRAYGHLMVGNAAVCAIRAGEWDWAISALEEWLATEIGWAARSEVFFDRSVVRSLRGEDASADLASARQLLRELEVTDPQWDSYEHWARAWAAFAAGRYAEAADAAERGADQTSFFAPLGYPLAIRAALHAGAVDKAAAILAKLDASGYRGRVLAADSVAAHAGIDALEGRGAAALAGYREALHVYRQVGVVFDEAATVVDMAVLLPSPERDAPDVVAAVDSTRQVLTRLRARPLLERLERAVPASVASLPG